MGDWQTFQVIPAAASGTPDAARTARDLPFHAAPVSITKDDEVASPRGDLIKGEGALFGNTSATPAPARSVDLPVTSDATALQYTLTSDAADTEPSGWVLQGSADGTTWTDLDRRSGQTDRQGTYTKYRLVSTSAATLAEVELIG